MATRILTRSDIARLCTMEVALDAVETAFAAHGHGEARMPVKVYLALPEHAGDFRAMPSYLAGAAGVKWVNSHPQNPARHGLPSVMGVYILSDPETAHPLAIMDATLLTAFRTGAAAGVATKYLFPGTPRSVGFVGCGVQARYLHLAHQALFSGFTVLAADTTPTAAEKFAAEVGGRAVSVAMASGCDIVCTSTPSRTPVVTRAAIAPGAHVNAIGADAPGKQELATDLLISARVFVDDLEQATESGEVNVPLHEGALTRAAIAGTLGDVVVGRVPARPAGDGTITVFDSTGLAVQDLSLARLLYQAAIDRGVGQDVALVD